MNDLKTVMSWLEGLTEDDWEEWYSHSEVQNTAKAAMELLKDQEAVEPRWFIDAHNPAGAFVCSACGERIIEKNIDFYCSKCGKPITWAKMEGR